MILVEQISQYFIIDLFDDGFSLIVNTCEMKIVIFVFVYVRFDSKIRLASLLFCAQNAEKNEQRGYESRFIFIKFD